MTEASVCLLGARSMLGKRLAAMLIKAQFRVDAVTRADSAPADMESLPGLVWHTVRPPMPLPQSDILVSMMPLWELPNYLAQCPESVKRLISFSSTSRLAKSDSPDPQERKLAAMLADAEEKVAAWAKARGIPWVILRPTMIYDEGKDKNVTAVANFIRKFGFFPIVGKGSGLRMPVYAEDLATAVLQILQHSDLPLNYYNLSGKDSITYREMVVRIFEALGKKPRIVHLPEAGLTCAIRCLRLLSRFRHLTPGIAVRMQKDQAFSSDDAVRDFAYAPRSFHPVFTH
ncbi:MAG TPA: NAD-dependent epimerase/dehydratase family protein [Rickettsiales bacterium]|nr:NAD-dependent epimerase/dehydratase family protein [Rickettsiales bacterium]